MNSAEHAHRAEQMLDPDLLLGVDSEQRFERAMRAQAHATLALVHLVATLTVRPAPAPAEAEGGES